MAGRDRRDHDEAVRGAAAAVEDFLLPGYGPGGGWKVVDGDPPDVIHTGAAALTEAAGGTGPADPLLQPYIDVARRTEAFVGDLSATAALLAAGLVRRAVEGPAPRVAYADGYALARRQTLAVLAAAARPATAADALATVAPPLAPDAVTVTDGLAAWAAATHGTGGRDAAGRPALDLDRVDIVVEAGADVAWAEGLIVQAGTRTARDRAGARVAVVKGGWTPKPRSDGAAWRMSRVEAARAEDAMRASVRSQLRALGVGVVLCGGAVDEALTGALEHDGVFVVADAGKDTLHRAVDVSGAGLVPGLEDVAQSDLGTLDVVRRHAGPNRPTTALLRGAGPAATLTVPTRSGEAMRDHAERLLRAAGQWLADPRVVPGGGRWQRAGAASLRRAADAGPRHTPFALHAAAAVLDGLADAVVRNLGRDPRRADPPEAVDLWLAVRQAVESGFDTAMAVLRVDGIHARRASAPEALRGGRGPAGSPRGMPGDLPPLM